MRCSFTSSSRSVRWPFAHLEVDDQGISVRTRRSDLVTVRWDELQQVVRCGFVWRDNVRLVPEDGPRLVVGGPKVVALIEQHMPEHLALRTERRRWFPWLPEDAGATVHDRRGDPGAR